MVVPRPGAAPGLGRVAGVFGSAVALAMALPACTSAQPSSSATGGGSQPASPPGMSCSWPSEFNVQAENVAMPDAAAGYWVQPIVASAGTRIVLSGRFPDARYASLSVYTPGGVGASLPDYRIAPQPGRVNPWQRQAAPGGRFTVTIRPDPSPGQASTLPLPPGTTSQHPGYLFYRVYLPAGGDSSDVPLPVLTVKHGSAARTLPACRTRNASVPFPARASAAGAGGSGAAAPPPPKLAFYKPTQSLDNAGLANVDTSYVYAWLIRPLKTRRGCHHGEGADLRARQPSVALASTRGRTSATGRCASAWEPTGSDRRQHAARGGTDYG